jgi:hypothetical protein
MAMIKIPHTRVEYDLEFCGGNYSDTGSFALIPHSVIDTHRGDVPAAFRAHTGFDPMHMIHYTEDEVYDQNGNLIDV